jgi:hypothetical protein
MVSGFHCGIDPEDAMTTRHIKLSAKIAMLLFASSFVAALPAVPDELAPPTLRDGQHDFDFDIGAWKTHSKRLLKPLTGSKQWTEMDGVTVVRPIWGGKGNLAELESDGPNGHLQLISLRLYDATAGQWNINFATSRVGILNVAGDTQGVPLIGRFENEAGTFYDQDVYEGRTIWVRFTIRPVSRTAARSEQAFSDDNGKTWETNWFNYYTKVSDRP